MTYIFDLDFDPYLNKYSQYLKAPPLMLSLELINAIWAYSKMAMESWPESKRTTMMADAERLGQEGFEEFMSSVGETNKICISNLETQQMYIDIWRDLAKSGLLKFPEN
jgi:hypothetical protein